MNKLNYSNNLLFKLLDSKIRGLQAALRNHQYTYPETQEQKTWRAKRAYYERVKILIENSDIDMKELEFNDGQ